jgi:hypothetical protein
MGVNDIVTRLRQWAIATDAVPASDLMDEAAAEIERLRSQPCPYVTGTVTRYCTLTPFTLTDAEREAVGRAAMLIDDTVIDDSDLALNDYQALRGPAVIVDGSVLGGFTFTGPFDTVEAASEWHAKKRLAGYLGLPTTIVLLENPRQGPACGRKPKAIQSQDVPIPPRIQDAMAKAIREARK